MLISQYVLNESLSDVAAKNLIELLKNKHVKGLDKVIRTGLPSLATAVLQLVPAQYISNSVLLVHNQFKRSLKTCTVQCDTRQTDKFSLIRLQIDFKDATGIREYLQAFAPAGAQWHTKWLDIQDYPTHCQCSMLTWVGTG